MNRQELNNEIKDRASNIRLRTWTLTLAIIVTLSFTILVTITTKQEMSVIDFVLLCFIQIITHCLYFPDGEIYGQKNTTYQENRQSYNDKATAINENKKIKRLRKYCKIEFEERKERYILNECGALDITLEELNILKQKSEEEIKKLKSYEFTYIDPLTKEEKSKLIFFTRAKRKKLYNLIFKKLPIEQNYPETIMSAVENNGNKAIKDGSISFKAHSYIRKILQAVVIGGVFAYIGYTVRDGIGIAEIMQIMMYLTALFSTAVLAYSSGETCSKVYKNRFYLELANFIDSFNEWDAIEFSGNEEILKEEKKNKKEPQETLLLELVQKKEENG